MDLKRRSIFLEMLIAGAALALLLGLTLPVVRLTWLYVFSNSHSIISVIWVLYMDKEWLLAGILVVFSLLFPIAKLLFLLILYIRRLDHILPGERVLAVLGWLGRWSMLDVLVLALIVFYAKQQGVADATVLPGIYFFAIAVLMTMWASELADQQFSALRRLETVPPQLTLIEGRREPAGE